MKDFSRFVWERPPEAPDHRTREIIHGSDPFLKPVPLGGGVKGSTRAIDSHDSPAHPTLDSDKGKMIIELGQMEPGKTEITEKFPHLRELCLALQEIDKDIFHLADLDADITTSPDYNKASREGKVILTYVPFVKDAMLYQAVVERWSYRVLEEKYREKIEELRGWAMDSVGAQLRNLSDDVLPGKIKSRFQTFGVKPGQGSDPRVEGSPILREGKRHELKQKLAGKWEEIKTTMVRDGGKNLLLFENGKSVQYHADPEKLSFYENHIIPFYQEWIVNKAIIEYDKNEDATIMMSAAVKDFHNGLIELYSRCKA